MNFFATTPKGLELLLVDELRALGASDAKEKLAGVAFSGDLALAYKACLWSRLANRILLKLAEFPASTPEALYQGIQTIAWDAHFDLLHTFSVHFVSSQSTLTHTLFGAQKVKDAIVDQFREKYSERPNIARIQPDVSIHVYLYRDKASVSLDLSGESLHRRGYRTEQGAAPLKENLAAAILLRAGWQNIAKEQGMLLDPMCGSGTLLIEGALLAGHSAPGLDRDYFGFLKWKKHDAALWDHLLEEAKEEGKKGFADLPPIIGFDEDPHAIKIAFANIERAGLTGKVHVEKRELSRALPNKAVKTGLFIVNPPYGERLGEVEHLQKLYEAIGEQLKTNYLGWRAAVFTGNPQLGKNMGLRAERKYALFNGAIPCELLLFDVESTWFVDRSPAATNRRRIQKAQKQVTEQDLLAVQMFINRLQKNVKHIDRWAKREGVSCYRIYDADLPEYAVSIDRYGDAIHVQDYPAPRQVRDKAERRLNSLLAVLPEALGIPSENIFFGECHVEGDLKIPPGR